MYKSSFAYSRQASRNKSKPRSKSVAARLPPSERTIDAVTAASASIAKSAAPEEAESEFPPKDYKEDVMKCISEGLKKWMKFMPSLPKSRVHEWDLPTLLANCGGLYDSLDPSIRLIPSRPQNLLQRKKTLACNIAWSVAPYIDVNGKRERTEFNRLFGAARNGPTRLTDQYVPESVKKHVEKLKSKKGGDDMKD